MSQAARPARVTAVAFEGDGVQLAADAAGDPADPPVVFLHGAGQTRASWKRAVETVAADSYHVLSLDLRGHGDSGWSPDGVYTPDRFAADLLRVLDELDRPATIVGASLGGLAALLAAGRAPGAVAALVLVDVAPRLAVDGASRIGAFMRAHTDGFDSLEQAAAAIAAYLPHRPAPARAEGLRKVLRQRADGRFHWHWDPRFVDGPVRPADIEAMSARLEAAARGLAVPLLLIRGAASEVVSAESVAALRALAPSAEVVDVEGAHHMVAGDRNDLFSDALLSFLRRQRGRR